MRNQHINLVEEGLPDVLPRPRFPKPDCVVLALFAADRFHQTRGPRPNAQIRWVAGRCWLRGSLGLCPKVCGRKPVGRDTSTVAHCPVVPAAKNLPNRWLFAGRARLGNERFDKCFQKLGLAVLRIMGFYPLTASAYKPKRSYFSAIATHNSPDFTLSGICFKQAFRRPASVTSLKRRRYAQF